jgi:hypothetical protein
VGTTASTSATFGSLACGTSYTLGVAAYDAAGNASATASASTSTTTCPVQQTPPTPPPRTISLAKGPAAPSGFRYAITLSNFPANTGVSLTCYDSVDRGGFFTFTLTTNGSGDAYTASQCYSGDGPDHWVRANAYGIESNHVQW